MVHWRSAFKATALGGAAEGEWRFSLEGFIFRQWINVIPVGAEKPVGVFQAGPSFNGVLELQGGRSYYWDSNFWLTNWIWSDGDGNEILRVGRDLSLVAQGPLEIAPDMLANSDVPLLSILGWYLIVLVSDFRPG